MRAGEREMGAWVRAIMIAWIITLGGIGVIYWLNPSLFVRIFMPPSDAMILELGARLTSPSIAPSLEILKVSYVGSQERDYAAMLSYTVGKKRCILMMGMKHQKGRWRGERSRVDECFFLYEI